MPPPLTTILAWLADRLIGDPLISQGGWRPDYIIGVGFGGTIFAGFCAKAFCKRHGREALLNTFGRTLEPDQGGNFDIDPSPTESVLATLSAQRAKVLLITTETHYGKTLMRQ